MVRAIGPVTYQPKEIPVQPIEEAKKRTDFSWFNSTLSSADKAQVYGANPQTVNDFIFGKVSMQHDTSLNGEMQAESRGEKSIPIVKSNKDVGAQENKLERDQLEALEEYINNRLEQIFNASTQYKTKRVQEKFIREQILDLQKELTEQQKKSTLLKWIDLFFTGGLVLAGIGSLILTIATGGAALPVIVVFGNAVFAIGSAGAKILNAVNKSHAEKNIGALIELGEKRQLIQTLSSESVDEIKDANDKELEAHKQKKKEQEKKEETSKSIYNRGG